MDSRTLHVSAMRLGTHLHGVSAVARRPLLHNGISRHRRPRLLGRMLALMMMTSVAAQISTSAAAIAAVPLVVQGVLIVLALTVPQHKEPKGAA